MAKSVSVLTVPNRTRRIRYTLHVAMCWLSVFGSGCGTHVEDRNNLELSLPTEQVATKLTIESLGDIATKTVRKGLTLAEVNDALLEKGIIPMRSSRSSGTTTFLYGSGSLADPVLFIDFEMNEKKEHRLAKWRVEE